MNRLVVFTLDEQRYALQLSTVERIVRVVEVTPLPRAPAIVVGVINVQGQVVPLVNIRKRFRLTERETDLSEEVIIAHTSTRTVALLADAVSGVVDCSPEEVIAAAKILPGLEYVEGIARLGDGMILIHDLDKFLSFEEAKTLDMALQAT